MPTVDAVAPSAPPSEQAKTHYLGTRDEEHQRTLRVMRAYPADRADLQPHPVSRSARELAFTFAADCDLCRGAITRNLQLPPNRPPAPTEWADVIDAYRHSYGQLVSVVRAMSDDELQETVPFLVAPYTMGDVPRIGLLWAMLFTEIHHRGQLSVYLRMSGSKVPSIYGPSYDEPWF